MVLIDASSRWSHVCLLSTRNVAFVKLLAHIIRLQAHFSNYPIKKIRLDNAGEFISKVFDDYCDTPKYTLVVFDMFRVFCKHNLNVS